MNVFVGGDQIDCHVNLSVVIGREQGPQRAVDQAGDEHLAVVGPPFAFHESAGVAPCGGVFLLVFHLQRHEVRVGFGVLGGHDGTQEHRVAHLDHHRTVGLLGQLARLDRDLASVGEGDRAANGVVQLVFFHKIYPKMCACILAAAAAFRLEGAGPCILAAGFCAAVDKMGLPTHASDNPIFPLPLRITCGG